MRALRRPLFGTSLVEAVVALAVMAFGMLAVVGVQSTLRLNADVAKQRSEAVRIAQEAMEAARAFAVIDNPVNGQSAYADIGDIAGQAVSGYTTNTSFSLTRTVVTRQAPDHKEIRIRVDWTDRSGEAQGVELNSIVAANDPRVSLLLAARPSGIPERLPLGRNPGIPRQAVPVGPGISAFKPPAASGTVVWVFDNLTGVIVGVCNNVATDQALLTSLDVSSCSDNANGLPLSGFVRFATDMVDTTAGLPRQPNAADAENPSSTALNVEVMLTLTSTGHASPDHACFAEAPSSASTTRTDVPYFCAIFFNTGVVPVWSGISRLMPLAFLFDLPPDYVPWALADNTADARASRYRVCRYTPATSDAQSIPNWQHPRNYSNVTVLPPLVNQNFLVIRAGDDVQPFTCPTDTAADPAAGDFVNSNTLVHQPAP
jgi:Tfp pilus assembly protein PilV